MFLKISNDDPIWVMTFKLIDWILLIAICSVFFFVTIPAFIIALIVKWYHKEWAKKHPNAGWTITKYYD